MWWLLVTSIVGIDVIWTVTIFEIIWRAKSAWRLVRTTMCQPKFVWLLLWQAIQTAVWVLLENSESTIWVKAAILLWINKTIWASKRTLRCNFPIRIVPSLRAKVTIIPLSVTKPILIPIIVQTIKVIILQLFLGDLFLLDLHLLQPMLVRNLLGLGVEAHWPLVTVIWIYGGVLMLKLLYHCVVLFKIVAVVHWTFLNYLSFRELGVLLLYSEEVLL